MGEASETALSRRAVLAKLGGAAVAGAGIVAVAETVAPTPAAANTGAYNDATGGITLSAVNTGSGVAFTGQVPSGGTGLAIWGYNAGTNTAVKAEIQNAANASASAYASTNGSGASVHGLNTGGGHGVLGEINAAGNGSAAVRATTNGTGRGVNATITSATNSATAVFGSTVGLGNAVEGRITNSNNTSTAVYGATTGYGRGVHGEAQGPNGTGVFGSANGAGEGVFGFSANGIGVVAGGGSAQLQLLPAPSVAAPTTGTHYPGEIFVDSDADVYVCVAYGTPGTWRRLTAAAPDYDNENGLVAGSVNYLKYPIRIFDTRKNTGGAGTSPLTSTGSADVSVAGVTFGAITIPAGAVAIVGNLTVTQTQNTSGSGGYLTAYPQGSPPPNAQATSSINWYAAGQTINNAMTAALNLTNGKFTIKNGINGGSSPTHVIFDAVAFVM